MNYSKKSTSRKQKALKGKGTKMGKKLGVVFMKTLLVLIIALGVAGLCGGIGIIKGVMENAPDITSASVLPRVINPLSMMRTVTRRQSLWQKEPTVRM